MIRGIIKSAAFLTLTGVMAASLPRDSKAAYLDERVDNARYTLFASGDTMLARWAHYAYYEKGPEWMLGSLKHLIETADVAMTNLECVVSTRGKFFHKGEIRPYAYRARPETLDVLTSMGFDVVSAGNNHSMDYGPKALLEEFELLEQAGIAWFGAGRNSKEAFTPTYVRVGDMVLAFIGLEDRRPLMGAKKDRPGVAHAHGRKAVIQALTRPVTEAVKKADLVIFSPHWGTNWTDNPDPDRIEVAHALIDMGVDLIIGHSSHQVHGIEVYKGCPIVYDMGSLLFDRVGQGRMRFGAAFTIEFDKAGVHEITIHPLRLSRNRTVLAQGKDAESVRNKIIELSRALSKDIRFSLQHDGTMILKLDNPRRPSPKTEEPERVHVAGSTRRLPERFRTRLDSNIVPKSPPRWTRGTESMDIGKGVTILGWTGSEAARPGRAFVHEVALRVAGPLRGGWFCKIVGKQRGGDGTFFVGYPFADGAWLPNLWKPGQVVVDRTLVRPPVLAPGTYDLYWGMQARGRARLPGRDLFSDTPDNLVPVGTIRIMTRGIPKGPAGVSWSGKLGRKTAGKTRQERQDRKTQALGSRKVYWIAAASLILAAAAIALAVRSRKKS